MKQTNIIEFAEELASVSGKVIKKYFRKNIFEIKKKDYSPVTIADKEAEIAMREVIMQEYPDHGIIGEEFEDVNQNADYKWVLDPIDGTISFSTGKPIFGTLIALTYQNIPILGIINQPIINERWIGTQNNPAYFNGKIIKTRKCESLNNAVLSTTSPFFLKGNELELFNKISKKTKYQHHGGVIYGGDCYQYGLLSSGFIDIVIESGLKIHDFAALSPVIESAGGIITDWEGNNLTLKSDGRVIACGDKRIHTEIIKIFNDSYKNP